MAPVLLSHIMQTAVPIEFIATRPPIGFMLAVGLIAVEGATVGILMIGSMAVLSGQS